jgi:tetratricopeptide (TPR) repeat protein
MPQNFLAKPSLFVYWACWCTLVNVPANGQPDQWTVNMRDGKNLLERGLPSEAQIKFVAALGQAERPTEATRLPASLTALGTAYTQLGRFDDAERLHRRALATVGSDDSLRPVILNNLAAVLHLRGDTAIARKMYNEVRAYWEEALGEGDARVGVVLSNIASTYLSDGRYEEAAATYSRALRLLEHSVGWSDHRSLNALSGYASTVAARKDYKRAEKLLNRVLSAFDKTPGAKNPGAVSVLIYLASLPTMQRKGKCVTLYQRAISQSTETFGNTHPTTLTALIGLANCLTTQHRYDQAIETAERALLRCEAQAGAHFEVLKAAAVANIAAANTLQKKYGDAESLYSRALTICESARCGAFNWHGTMLLNYASVLRKLGRGDDASALEARARINGSGPRSRQVSMVDLRDLQQVREAADPTAHK